jgi:nucleotide-binding universal stress UspA family protein
MFEHAVVGVDFTPGGRAVLESLGSLRALGTRSVTLVHAVHVPYGAAGIADDTGPSLRQLDEARGSIAGLGLEVDVIALPTDPARALHEVAASRGANLIVVGSRGQSYATEAFVGNTVWEVARETRLPILVLRIEPGGPESAGAAHLPAGPIHHVLHPTDFSETSGHAFDLVESLARHGAVASFSLLHVRSQIEEARTGRTTEGADRERLEAMAERLRSAGAESVTLADPSGAPHVEISRAADTHPGTVIVMGTHGRGWVSGAFVGSVSRDVVRHGRHAVLLVPRR